MVTIIDDGLLARVIAAGDPRHAAGVEAPAVVTTGLWYYRFARALLDDGSISGRLSTAFGDIDPETRLALVSLLPEGVTVMGLDAVTPTAATAARDAGLAGIHLNALAAEAVGVALQLGGELLVATPSPSLAAAADLLGLGYSEVL